MFEWLAEFRKVFVTGPQRSGTRIAACMISNDTGMRYVDEKEFRGDSLTRVHPFLMSDERMVLQCPGLCRWAHLFTAPDIAVALMRRSVDDIVASQKRIGWSYERTELMKYDLLEGRISEVKYRFWDETQRPLIHNPVEIEYESLADHPMWTPKSKRADFRWDQTKPTDEPAEQPAKRTPPPVTFYRV